MKPVAALLFTACLFLTVDSSAYRPRYWKKTRSEKIMDKVYKSYGQSGARSRRLWNSMHRNRGRRGGISISGSRRSVREWVPRKRCTRLSFAGMKPSRLSQSGLKRLLQYSPIRRSRQGWTNWSQWSMSKRLGHYIDNCPIRPREASVVRGILAGRYEKKLTFRYKPRKRYRWRPRKVSPARKRVSALHRRAADMRRRHKNGYLPPRQALTPLPRKPVMRRITYRQHRKHHTHPGPMPGCKMVTTRKFWKGATVKRIEYECKKGGKVHFLRTVTFSQHYPPKRWTPFKILKVRDEFYCEDPLVYRFCYLRRWYYGGAKKRRGPYGKLRLKNPKKY